jgi:hypothetical protein
MGCIRCEIEIVENRPTKICKIGLSGGVVSYKWICKLSPLDFGAFQGPSHFKNSMFNIVHGLGKLMWNVRLLLQLRGVTSSAKGTKKLVQRIVRNRHWTWLHKICIPTETATQNSEGWWTPTVFLWFLHSSEEVYTHADVCYGGG